MNKQHIDHIAHAILRPEWHEPSASLMFNLWSNLEFLGVEEGDKDYDTIINRAVSLCPERTFRRRITVWEDITVKGADSDGACSEAHDTCEDRADEIENAMAEDYSAEQGRATLIRTQVIILDDEATFYNHKETP